MTDQPLVRVLGPITVRRPDGERIAPARLDRVVLAHLALAEGRAVAAGDLIEAVWGPFPPAGARNALQVKVSRLRRHLGPLATSLEHRQGSYRLDLPVAEVDVRLFEQLCGTASRAAADGRPDAAAVDARRALDLWHGEPLAGLDEHPRLVAARSRLSEQRAALGEVLADATLESGQGSSEAIGILRGLLADDPLRPRARLLLMRALDRSGRRAEALAVYDLGRRVLAEQTGLAPPAPLQEEFERLLADERRAARRVPSTVDVHAVPAGAMDTARWLAREGATGAAFELALRGCWWWWLGGRRSEGRDLLEDLVGLSGTSGADSPTTVGATAWLSVFDSVTARAEEAIAAGEGALRDALELGWGRHESIAAVLLAERLFQRGEPRRAALLLHTSRAGFEEAGDLWGLALVDLTAARGDLQRGILSAAAAGGRTALRAFEELADPAGQMMAMDLLGYCAEVGGDLLSAAQTHQRALALAREVQAPEWQATQLTRLGSVQALLGAPQSVGTLQSAVALARAIGSAAGVALAENGLGLARGLLGDHDDAAQIHATSLGWYEQQGSRAGMSYTAGRLALELATAEPEQAAVLAARAVDLASRTGDPRAIAHGLESVAVAHPDAPTRARALGGARSLRRRTRSPLPRVIATSLRAAEQQLGGQLGDELVAHLRAGAREAEAVAGLGATS